MISLFSTLRIVVAVAIQLRGQLFELFGQGIGDAVLEPFWLPGLTGELKKSKLMRDFALL